MIAYATLLLRVRFEKKFALAHTYQFQLLQDETKGALQHLDPKINI